MGMKEKQSKRFYVAGKSMPLDVFGIRDNWQRFVAKF